MSNFLILNGAQPYPFAPGGLNATLAERAKAWAEAEGHAVRLTAVAKGYDVETEVQNHRWADAVILQDLDAKFFPTEPLPSFDAFDVMKNPEIESDLARFDAHLARVFAEASDVAA